MSRLLEEEPAAEQPEEQPSANGSCRLLSAIEVSRGRASPPVG